MGLPKVKVKSKRFYLPSFLSRRPKPVKIRGISRKAPTFVLPKDLQVIDTYSLYDPFARATIAESLKTGELIYFINEIRLSDMEKHVRDRVVDVLETELQATMEVENPREYFTRAAKQVVDKYKVGFGKEIGSESWDRIVYYVERDLAGYGAIDPLMRDPNIEDISCDGVRKPVYVWHRKYENMRTNLIFQSEEELDNLIIKLVHMAGKHISSAFPIVDAILPDKHRLSACFRREVTPFGSTFTIRKFRTDPFTAVDFINMNTFDASLAAYLWLCMENRLSVIILGGTAAGKTSLLNVLVSLIKPGTKIITIEETPELNLPQENWVSLTSRESYGLGAEKIGEVTLFDLVKASLRHRPDILIVGEVRGEEAYVLFQALATGHGGMCTMHAEDLTSAIKRLTAPPMNVAPVYIPLMNLILTIRRVKGVARRVVECHEIVDYGDYVLTSKWQPEKDAFKYNFNESVMLKRISDARGWTLRQTLSELRHREKILLWMAKEGIRDLKSVANMVTEYYRRPKAVYKRLSRV